MAARLIRLVVVRALLLGAALPSATAAAVVRPPTSQDIAAASVPARGADAANPRSYFGARYYRADLGRFTTIDPVYTWPENLADPQRWNRYSYVRNNPLSYTDPTGMYIAGCNLGEKACAKEIGRFEGLRQTALKSKDAEVRAAAQRLGEPGKEGPTVSPDFKGDLKGANGNFDFSENVLLFKPGISGVEGVRTVVHEASHHSDRVLALGVPKNDDWQITRWESDVRAFDLGARVTPYATTTGVLRPGDRAAIEAYMRTRVEYYNRAMYYPIVNRGW